MPRELFHRLLERIVGFRPAHPPGEERLFEVDGPGSHEEKDGMMFRLLPKERHRDTILAAFLRGYKRR